MEPKHIQSVADLIEHFRGPKAVADLLGTTPQNVVNWRAQNALPARKFLVQLKTLRDAGVEPAPSLWGMAEAAE